MGSMGHLSVSKGEVQRFRSLLTATLSTVRTGTECYFGPGCRWGLHFSDMGGCFPDWEVGWWTATRAHQMDWLVFKQPGPQRAIAVCGCIRSLLGTGRRLGLVPLLRGHAAFLR